MTAAAVGGPNWLAANYPADIATSLADNDYFVGADGKLLAWNVVRSLNIYATYADLPALGLVTGQEALVTRLVGTGAFKCRYNGTRWVVVPGEMIAAQNDPYSAVAPGSTSNIDNTWCTIPAGLVGDGEEWEFDYPHETGTNTGSDSTNLIIGSVGIGTSSVASGAFSSNVIRISRIGTAGKRTLSIIGTAIAATIVNTAIDFTTAKSVVSRISPINANNTSYVRRIAIRRVS